MLPPFGRIDISMICQDNTEDSPYEASRIFDPDEMAGKCEAYIMRGINDEQTSTLHIVLNIKIVVQDPVRAGGWWRLLIDLTVCAEQPNCEAMIFMLSEKFAKVFVDCVAGKCYMRYRL